MIFYYTHIHLNKAILSHIRYGCTNVKLCAMIYFRDYFVNEFYIIIADVIDNEYNCGVMKNSLSASFYEIQDFL